MLFSNVPAEPGMVLLSHPASWKDHHSRTEPEKAASTSSVITQAIHSVARCLSQFNLRCEAKMMNEGPTRPHEIYLGDFCIDLEYLLNFTSDDNCSEPKMHVK